jgi:hypothetical protein
MELGGVPEKMDEYFHWGPIFYVCSSARNWVSSMYQGKCLYIYINRYIIYVYNSLWGIATLDV